ncbi:MAG: GEVED domain-containing protein [Candidatus Promineifilaceae bacterium]
MSNRSKLSFVGLIATFILTTMAGGMAVSAEPDHAREAHVPNVYLAANFTVNYRGPGDNGTCDTSEDGALIAWPNDAKTAMNHVIDILDDLITSSQTIVVDACYQPHQQTSSLAYAGATDSYNVDNGMGQAVYAVALQNAIDNTDNNGASPEITTSTNSAISWDYCTTNCSVDPAKFDFVSTLVHEFLHGLGFAMGFGVDNDNAPTVGNYPSPPTITDIFVYTSADYATNPNKQITSLPNNTAALLNIYNAGSGMVEFRGTNTLTANGFAPYIFSVANDWQSGSSMSHLDDNHATNMGRMMNAATGSGPSSRTVDAITLMFLKDIGWTIAEASDYGDTEFAAYGSAQHINTKTQVNSLWLGTDFSTENAAIRADTHDDGVTLQAWSDGADNGKVSLTVGSNTTNVKGCASIWIDWDGNDNFTDSADIAVAMMPVTNGSQDVMFTVPSGTFTGSGADKMFNARVRLQPDWDRDGVCNDQVGMRYQYGIAGGEVEDYQWTLSNSGALITAPSVTPRAYLPILSK